MNTIRVYEVKKSKRVFLGCLDYINFYNLLRKLKDLGMRKYSILNGIKEVSITRFKKF